MRAPGLDDGGTRIELTTVVIGVWTFLTLIWSIFTPPQYTFPARALLLQPLWYLNLLLDDDTVVQDLVLTLGLHAGFSWVTGAWSLPRWTTVYQFASDPETLYTTARLFALLVGCGILAALTVFRGEQIKEAASGDEIGVIDENVLPPLLIPSRTTHSRFFPKKHSFSYSYLFAGVPVGSTGRYGRALSVDTNKRAWFHVDGADYLERSDVKMRLAEKLSSYLRTQGVTDVDYEYAYLVTAPRFLGYSFNPVSFWYIYDADIALKYMILEVNNTFDERRMYLLRPGQQDPEMVNGDTTKQLKNGSAVFTQQWDKDFHVSPFNSRKGSYSLRAVDPLVGGIKPVFDNTIVLRSSKDRAKITARVSSQGAALLPTETSALTLARFVMSWWWVGLMTLPRIIWEAQKLYLSKQLDVYFRPEVTTASIGRTATADERRLEYWFRFQIVDLAAAAKFPIRMIYETPFSARQVTIDSHTTNRWKKRQILRIKVISPAFYSRYVHYTTLKEAFDRECLATDEKNRTILIEPIELISALPAVADAQRAKYAPTLGKQWRWRCMRALRCPPAAVSFPSSKPCLDSSMKDIRRSGYSDLDCYIQDEDGPPWIGVYRRIATKLFLAQRFAYGLPDVVAAADRLVRAILVIIAMIYIQRVDCFDILRPRPHNAVDWLQSAILLLLANSIHIYKWIKGSF